MNFTVYLRAPREVAQELYQTGILYPGFPSDPASGIDTRLPAGATVESLARYVDTIRQEAQRAGEGVIACLWHPTLPAEVCRKAIGSGIIEIQTTSTDDALQKLLTATSPPPKHRGLGDTVAAVLDATGVGPAAKAVIKKVTGKPCGCQQRQEALNQLVPYRNSA